MLSGGTVLRLALALALVLTCGCRPYAGLLRRASNEMSCSEEYLDVRPIGAGGYVVTGCGHSRTYVCSQTLCIAQSETRTSAPSASRSAGGSTWSDDAVRQLLADMHDQTLACYGAAHVPARLRIVIGRSGRVSDYSSMTPATVEEGRCVADVLSRVSATGGPHAPRTVVLQIAPRAQDISPTAGGFEAAPESAEDAARAEVAVRARTILLCTGGTAVGVSLEWVAEGGASVGLVGALHGSAQEGCVQRAFEGVQIPAAGRSGSIIQAVEP